jgi:SpoVK/Ycf46/Vps4 family AAA+-type ATPase
MSLTKAGLDVDAIWERKKQIIDQTPGLQVWRGGETFADIGGVDNVKSFVTGIANGEEPPRAIVFIDEIEKSLAGAAGGMDTSGVSQDQLGVLLTEMQNSGAAGMIFIGPPGSAKSMIAKAAGATLSVPTITFDLGAMKGSLVGESEARIRNAFKVVWRISQGRALFVATCNKIGNLPPELRRRFSLGTYFFDLPSDEERAAIWKLHFKKYKIKPQDLPDDAGWTGAEIRNCADIAWRLGVSLKQASSRVVPVARSAPEMIERLRTECSGKYISASYDGVYEYKKTVPVATGGRKISLD